MKSLSQVIVSFLIFSLVFIECGPRKSNYSYQESWQEVQNPCGIEVARIIGQLYTYSIPLNDQVAFAEWIESNNEVFQENSPVILCTRKLGNYLTQSAMQNFNPNQYDETYESVIGMGGGADWANDIASDMSNEQLQPYLIGQELLWLANSIPNAADGDWYKYNNEITFTRSAIMEQMQMVQIFGMQDMMTSIMGATNEGCVNFIVGLAAYSGLFE